MQHTQIISIDVMEKQTVGVKRYAFEFEYICYDRTSKLKDKNEKSRNEKRIELQERICMFE